MTWLHSNGLLDTNAVILLARLPNGSLLPSRGAVSTISLAELEVGPLVAENAAVAAMRQADLRTASAFRWLPFDVASARAYARVVASLRAAGRKGASRTTDAMIAAVAIANGLPLYTCSPADFAGIDELELVPVPHPDRPTTPPL